MKDLLILLLLIRGAQRKEDLALHTELLASSPLSLFLYHVHMIRMTAHPLAASEIRGILTQFQPAEAAPMMWVMRSVPAR
mmetsp:Transcript_10718/g.11564  ORF Transcript_10718/g.11564 Transcript_10718/m.11564 type:complete len:80 (-) Transcript_10718:2485-2724(-)